MALEIPLYGVVFLEQILKLVTVSKHFMTDRLFVCNNYHHMCNTISPNINTWPQSTTIQFHEGQHFSQKRHVIHPT